MGGWDGGRREEINDFMKTTHQIMPQYYTCAPALFVSMYTRRGICIHIIYGLVQHKIIRGTPLYYKILSYILTNARV